MLKKLRIKLTIITMSLVTFVLLAVMATMMIGNFHHPFPVNVAFNNYGRVPQGCT